ncbi:MAG: WYL domain-containing protein [Candidatus Gastranaerophilales bacterium]|nr:WYL domain-containing protein [Candidatus Gastranaerophilales bacterium]
MAKKLKTSSTAYRVLLLLYKLNEKPRTVNELNDIFFCDPEVGRYFSNDVILKYINTLKEAGYEIIKQAVGDKSQFVLKKAPVQMHLEQEDINTLALLMCYSKTFCQDRFTINNSTFIDKICRYLSQEQINTLKKTYEVQKEKHKELINKYEKYSELIKKVEQCIVEKQRVEIRYKLPEDEQEKLCVTRFHKLKYEGMEVKLLYCDLISGQMNSVKLDYITNIKPLPTIPGERQVACPVVFKVKGRLAKTYRPYEGEVVGEYDKITGETTVTAYADDVDSLLMRLLKYGENCEVTYPNMMRESAANLIRLTLNNYKSMPS